MKTQHILALSLLAFLFVACGGAKEDKKEEGKKEEGKKEEAKKDEAKKEDRLTLLEVADADFKCDVKETKITKLVIDGKEQPTEGLNQVFAQYWGTSQTVVITNFKLDKAKYFAFTCDVKKMAPTDVRIEIGFNRYKRVDNNNKTIAPELGEYSNKQEGFGLSAAVYSKDKAMNLLGKAFLKAINTTKICVTFELKTQDGKYEIVGEVVGENYIKP